MLGRQSCVRQIAAAAVLAFALPALAAEQAAKPAQRRALPTQTKQWQGDFDGMVERRMIRLLVPYSRTLYFNDKGRERGMTADYAREFERYVNQKFGKQLGKRPITVFIIPTTRDKLLQNVVDGYGDLAAGNITATEERAKIADLWVPPDNLTMNEIVVTGPKSPAIGSADDLSGKTVHVRKSSSYYDSLGALNERFKQERRPAVKLVLVPDALEDEDMMEMVEAGLLQAIVVDDWKAKMWAQVLPKIKVNAGAVLRAGGQRAWVMRKDSPKLRAVVAEFYDKSVRLANPSAVRLAQYFRRIKQIHDPTTANDRRRFEATLDLFRKYGKQYHFDPLMLAAQGYQESQLNQKAKSRVGAIGIMQVMPATGTELKVGDINGIEANIHADTKYMDVLMTRYFKDAKFSETDRTLFAFASYNCGAGNVSRMRKEAAKRGLDPDQWFNNVEIVTAEKIGAETTTYVRNIFKYYTAYSLMSDIEAQQKKAEESVK